MEFANEEEFRQHLIDNADLIFVREKINDKWGSHALSDLPEELRTKHIEWFVRGNRMPVMLKRRNKNE